MEWRGGLQKIVGLLPNGDSEDFCFLVKATSANRKFHEFVYKGIHLLLPFFCIVAIDSSIEIMSGQKRSATYTRHSQGWLSQVRTKITIHASRETGRLIVQMTQTVASLCMFNILSGIGHDRLRM